MSKTKQSLNGAKHSLVADRIELFYSAFPEGRIITELVSRANGEITFKASVFRSASDGAAAATGWAVERESDGDANILPCVENTETSAIGRALANLGFAPPRQPGLDDSVTDERVVRSATPAPHDAVARAPSPLGIGTRPPEPPTFSAPPRAASAPVPAVERAAGREAIADVVALLDTAERSGYSAERAQGVRQRLAGGDVPASALLRVERALRRWLAERDAHT